MNIDPTSDEATLRKQLIEAIMGADGPTLRVLAQEMLASLQNPMAKEPQVPYEPEVPLILRKPSDEQLVRELNDAASRNDSVSNEEAHAQLTKRFG
jgi:hypothetical protein